MINKSFYCRTTNSAQIVDLDVKNEIEQIMKTKLFQTELHKSLSNCVEQYHQIINYCQMTEKFFSPVLFPGIMFLSFYLIFSAFCAIIVSLFFTLHYEVTKKHRKVFSFKFSDGR